jgi:hypothetical protein
MQNKKSWNSVYSAEHSGNAARDEFAVASTAYNAYYKPYQPYVAALDPTTVMVKSNKYFQMVDLERINGSDSSYTGISTNGSASFIRLNINAALANVVHNFQYYSYFDVLLIFDLASGQVIVSST